MIMNVCQSFAFFLPERKNYFSWYCCLMNISDVYFIRKKCFWKFYLESKISGKYFFLYPNMEITNVKGT